VPIESVTCPENANFKAGSTFECEAKAQGVNFGIQVKMENEQGKFNTNIKGLLLNLSKIEDKLQATLKEKAGTDVTADCGGKLRAAKTGDTFTCQLKNKEGQTRNVQITVKNEKGELNVKL
jgi:C-terminal processing protease CtpA/Prc